MKYENIFMYSTLKLKKKKKTDLLLGIYCLFFSLFSLTFDWGTVFCVVYN